MAQVTCPHCGETRQIDYVGRQAFCNTCGKLWIVNPATPRPAP